MQWIIETEFFNVFKVIFKYLFDDWFSIVYSTWISPFPHPTAKYAASEEKLMLNAPPISPKSMSSMLVILLRLPPESLFQKSTILSLHLNLYLYLQDYLTEYDFHKVQTVETLPFVQTRVNVLSNLDCIFQTFSSNRHDLEKHG